MLTRDGEKHWLYYDPDERFNEASERLERHLDNVDPREDSRFPRVLDAAPPPAAPAAKRARKRRSSWMGRLPWHVVEEILKFTRPADGVRLSGCSLALYNAAALSPPHEARVWRVYRNVCSKLVELQMDYHDDAKRFHKLRSAKLRRVLRKDMDRVSRFYKCAKALRCRRNVLFSRTL